MTAFPIFSGVYQRSPIPPWVFSNPSSMTNFPGPTCSQPVMSLPLKSCFHSPDSGSVAKELKEKTRKSIRDHRSMNHLRPNGLTHPRRLFYTELGPQSRRCAPGATAESEAGPSCGPAPVPPDSILIFYPSRRVLSSSLSHFTTPCAPHRAA